MRLEHTFSVPAPKSVVWQALMDLERVAPCMPGATLTSVDGDAFTGTVKVKLGPITLLYKGTGEFLEKDEAASRAVVKAAGKDSRGNGTASATVTMTLVESGGVTEGTVLTDLAITGKPAQFGRGMIAEVGGKLLDAFATCLAGKLAPAETGSGDAPQQEPDPRPPPGAGPAKPTTNPTAKPTAEPAAQPAAEAIDLMQFAGASVAKRVAPVAAVLLVLLAVILIRKRSS